MKDVHDAWFFAGLFAFVFLVWLATGGQSRPLAWSGPTLAQPNELGGGTYLQLPRAPFGIGNRSTNLGGSYGQGESPLKGIAFGSPSPSSGSVQLRPNVNNASSTYAQNEYLILSVPTTNKAVTISGWYLTSEITGKAGLIPKGTSVPTTGIVNAQKPIVLNPGQIALIFTGRSPIGTSFQENKCSAYLQSFQNFTPSFYGNCPDPLDELIAFYGPYYARDTSCVDYIKKLPSCETVLFPPDDLSSTCTAFVKKHFNYNGCINTHYKDADFLGNTWRVYLGLNDSMWRARNEVVKLLDANKRTIDAFAY